MKVEKNFQMKFFLNKKKEFIMLLKNSNSEAVVKFKEVLEKIING